MERPQTKVRKPELLYIVGCEGKNQETKYFEKVQEIINSIPSRKCNVLFDFAEPFGGDPLCVVERTVTKSIGKTNKAAIFDYDGKKKKYEQALELATENKIDIGNTNYCFDLWMILHKEDYFVQVSHQDDYANELRRVYGLSSVANIKKESNVETVVNQISLEDIVNAVRRAELIEAMNSTKTPNVTEIKKLPYYDNPDTQIHLVLKEIFRKAGIEINCNVNEISKEE